MASEDLWRAALHDFNNLLAGLQGVLDLSDPRLPLDARNRQRFESSIEDGKTLVAMARALALGRFPDPGSEPWEAWRLGLARRLEVLSVLFRCPIEVVDAGAGAVPWPAPLLQDWAAAFTRQILPWVAPQPLRLEARVTDGAWVLSWPGDAPLPACLRPDPPADAPRNLASLWLRAQAERMDLAIEARPGGLEVRMKRP